jgi:hypothetical protein
LLLAQPLKNSTATATVAIKTGADSSQGVNQYNKSIIGQVPKVAFGALSQ